MRIRNYTLLTVTLLMYLFGGTVTLASEPDEPLPSRVTVNENIEKGKVDTSELGGLLNNTICVIDEELQSFTTIEAGAKNLKRKMAKNKKRPIEELIKEVANGSYGNGEARKTRLLKEGYDYEAIQKEVNKQTPQVEEQMVLSASHIADSQTIKAYPHVNFKSYMAWTTLASNSPQAKLARKAQTSDKGILVHEGRYLVALGFAYADHIGQHIDIVMESGQVIKAIVGDFKAVAHTDEWNSASLNNGSIIEFIVASNEAAYNATSGSGSYDSHFPGKVKEFRK